MTTVLKNDLITKKVKKRQKKNYTLKLVDEQIKFYIFSRLSLSLCLVY